MENSLLVQLWIAIAIGLLACVDDLCRRKIANWIPFLAFVTGFYWQSYNFGWAGSLFTLEGAALGFLVFLIFYLLGGMGGGDVKLMTGFGALLGPDKTLEAALWTAGVGGIIALAAVIVISTRRWLRGLKPLPELQQSIPYAPAIAIGVWITLCNHLL